MEDLRPMMPLLEGELSDSGLDNDAATRLIEFVVCRPWPDYWVSRALGWVDRGVWSDAIGEALRSISQDKGFSQDTRNRAWRYVKHTDR